MELIHGLNNGMFSHQGWCGYHHSTDINSHKITIFLRKTKWPPGGCLSISDPLNREGIKWVSIIFSMYVDFSFLLTVFLPTQSFMELQKALLITMVSHIVSPSTKELTSQRRKWDGWLMLTEFTCLTRTLLPRTICFDKTLECPPEWSVMAPSGWQHPERLECYPAGCSICLTSLGNMWCVSLTVRANRLGNNA